MKTGICNEVYLVTVANNKVIVRMNKMDRFLKGSSTNIPVFKSRGVLVPEILFEDYSNDTIPYSYQILTFIEGEDLGKVIQNLNKEQLQYIAKEVSDIFLKLADVPTNGKFGWTDSSDAKLVNSWSDVMLETYYKLRDRNERTGVVGKELIDLFSNLISKHKEYFDKVPSRYVYDDICSKNVIINDGKFNGLVDLDQIMYGDFLEPIGRIQASWYDTDYGRVYTEALMGYLNLNEEQKKLVSVYALLSRIAWLSEIGIKFNQNTSTDIDQNRVNENKRIIELMRKELL